MEVWKHGITVTGKYFIHYMNLEKIREIDIFYKKFMINIQLILKMT